MVEAYAPVLILLGVSIVNAIGMAVVSHFLSSLRPTPVKRAPYESGMTPVGSTRERFSVKFYMVALLFIVFDIEAVFLIPWAVAMRDLAWQGFFAVLIFLIVLTVGLVYEWKKGAMEWE